MLKEFLIVGAGSFFGGGLRFVVSRFFDVHVASAMARTQLPAACCVPAGTLAVNVLGCFLIGFVSGIPSDNGLLSPHTRLFLTTGFCGGFTTFSTFINENSAMMRSNNLTGIAVYILASLAIGFIALLAGNWAARLI